ncbi:MAG: hypothetical protein QOI31_1689 [Solirubrobacterales bacterium]|nr:hypothetical protein [Solirubrobacterales bacterium]
MQIEGDQLTTLRRSLIDRAQALGSYIEELQTDSGRSDDGFSRALRLAHQYTRDLVEQVKRDARELDNPGEVLREHLESFLRREEWIDQRFARGRQRDVPRALKTSARDEFEKHELTDHEPVLTVGAPDNFETYRVDLQEYLFADIERPSAFEAGKRLSIFSVPYIEGTRALWYPIVLGHEVAHARIDNEKGELGSLDLITDSWLPGEEGALYGSAVEEITGVKRRRHAASKELKRRLYLWALELVCDLNAVRVFGPAGMSSIGEFVAMLASQEAAGTIKPSTHPPLELRLLVMKAFVKRLGFAGATAPAHCKVWIDASTSPDGALGAVDQLLWSVLEQDAHVEALIALVESWGEDSYRHSEERSQVVDSLAAALLDGLPGSTHVLCGKDWVEATVADVVNGAWAARSVLDELEADPDYGASGALVTSDMEPRDKRLRLDSLASKAIDTLELKRLWGEERGVISPHEVENSRASSAPAGVGGVLSRSTITRRLVGTGVDRDQRMHVIPLFADSVGDAAVDLRLGPDFIVFRHSATSVFDPIADQDPRQLQERVRKSWGEQFILHPQELVLASTLEYIVVPEDVASQVITRSSYGRLGLITATAVQVQPGSRGCITLELVNHGETPIALTPGARVAQLMSWTVTEPCEVDAGKYWFPVGPEFSKVQEDEDRSCLHRLEKRIAPPQYAEEAVVVRYAGSPAEAQLFQDLALSQGGEEFTMAPDPDRRGVGVVEVGIAVSAISIALERLARVIQRWLQGRATGVSVEDSEFGFVIKKQADLPKGTILLRKSDGLEVVNLSVPPATERDLLKALQKLFAIWRKDGRPSSDR